MKKYAPLVLTLALLFLLFMYTPVKGIFLYISKPFLNFGERGTSKISNFFETVKTIKNLAIENSQLKEEIKKLQSDKIALLEKEKENEILKKQLGFTKENNKQEFIPSQIIGRSPTSFTQYLILNKGSRDGINKGQVIISEGFLVGKIKETYENTSLVFLITNSTSVVAALTLENRSSGIIKGDIGYGLSLVEIPKESPVKEGENVVTSGLGGEYPKGIPIGQIDKISSSDSDLFQSASLKMPLDFFKLEYVLVIK